MQLFYFPDFIYTISAVCKYSVKIVQCPGTQCQINTINCMMEINIFYIFSYIRPFDLILFQIRHCHNNNIRIHFHHKCYKLHITDIICLQLLTAFCKNSILRIACDIMDNNICLFQQHFYDAFEVFIKSASFGIKNYLFIFIF